MIDLLMDMHTLTSILPDINECLSDETHNCSYICTNIIGSYICGCNNGFYLDNDETTCIGMYK